MPAPRLREGQPPLYVQGGLSGCETDLRHALHEVRLHDVIAQGAEILKTRYNFKKTNGLRLQWRLRSRLVQTLLVNTNINYGKIQS